MGTQTNTHRIPHRRWAVTLAVLALIGSACAEVLPSLDLDPGPAPLDAPATLPVLPPSETVIDLTDPDMQARLGSPPLEDIVWERVVAGETVVGTTGRADPVELDLIAAAIGEMPRALTAAAQPRTIVRAAAPPADTREHDAIAFAQGPDVYFVDSSFTATPGGSTRLDLARAYAHELAHVAQFFSYSHDYVRAALDGQIGEISASAGSTLVRDFAAATGWIDTGSDAFTPRWRLPDGVAASSSYGRQGPEEDMAEAVALVVIGRADLVPADRVAWVEAWLGASAEQLAAGKPWAPAGSEEVLSAQPIYDETRVSELAAVHQHAEPLYFELDAGASPHPELASTIAQRLLGRGLLGDLDRVDDPAIARYSGLFNRRDGVQIWVELWDFRDAPGYSGGPDGPVLTYVMLW